VKSLAVQSKFPIAMAAYVALAIIAWRTLTGVMPIHLELGKVVVDRQVPLVWIVWLLLGLFAFKTVLFDLRLKLEKSADAKKDQPM